MTNLVQPVQGKNLLLTRKVAAIELNLAMNRNRSTGHSAGQHPPAHGVVGFIQRGYGQRRRGATFLAAILAIALGYQVVFGQNGLTAYEKKRHDAMLLDEQLKRLAEENERLQGHVDRLQDDPGAIEHQAREELHYTRPGEVIVTLPNEAPAKTATP